MTSRLSEIKNKIFEYANMYKVLSTLAVLAIIENDFETVKKQYDELKKLDNRIKTFLKIFCSEEELENIKNEKYENLPESLSSLKIIDTYNKVLALKYSNMKFDVLEEQILINKMSIDFNYQEEFSYINLANILYENEKYSEIIELSNVIKDMGNTAPVWEILGKTYRQLGRYGEAIEAYRKYLELNENDLDALSTLDEIYEEALI